MFVFAFSLLALVFFIEFLQNPCFLLGEGFKKQAADKFVAPGAGADKVTDRISTPLLSWDDVISLKPDATTIGADRLVHLDDVKTEFDPVRREVIGIDGIVSWHVGLLRADTYRGSWQTPRPSYFTTDYGVAYDNTVRV